jgi:3-hydroxyisobutyrate dehydrogenase
MFGGPAAVLDAHRPVLDAIAGNVFHVGESAGQGQAMKLLNNFLSAVALAATSEAVSFGQAEGLDMQVMVDVLNVSTGRNSATYDKFPNRVMTGTYDAGFHTRLMSKDVKLFLESIDGVGTSKVVASAIGQVWAAADAAMPGSDFTEIWKFVSEQ